jgi:hypothetical protein
MCVAALAGQFAAVPVHEDERKEKRCGRQDAVRGREY